MYRVTDANQEWTLAEVATKAEAAKVKEAFEAQNGTYECCVWDENGNDISDELLDGVDECKSETYTIPTTERETIEKAVKRYEKKAAAYGCKFSITMGEPYAAKRTIYDRESDEYGNPINIKVGSEMIEVFDVTIESDLIRKDGYTVIAKLEHLEGGNVVVTFGDECKPEWSTLKPRCQHCGGNHGQKITFIVRHEDGTELQVGRTCLKDYCGIDPARIAFLKQLRDLFLGEDIDHHDFNQRPATPAYSTIEALALAIRVMKAQGYVKSGEINSNRSTMHELVRKSYRPTANEIAAAEDLARKIGTLDRETAFSRNLSNVSQLVHSGYCKYSHFGYIAYAPLAYQQYEEHRERELKREAEKDAERRSSEYVGEIGQRITIDIAEMKLLTSWETQYGMTYLYKFVDKQGNVLVWFASKTIADCSVIKGTVKDHTERDGVKQTVLTRCACKAA